MARTKLTKSYQIKHSKHIGRPGSGLEYIFQSHFTKFAQIKKFICTDKSLANIRESSWTYLVVCRIVSVSAEIENNERVSEFTDPPSLNSDTRMWIQRRLWITSSAEPDIEHHIHNKV